MILMVESAFSFSALKAGSPERSHHTAVHQKKEHQKVKPTTKPKIISRNPQKKLHQTTKTLNNHRNKLGHKRIVGFHFNPSAQAMHLQICTLEQGTIQLRVRCYCAHSANSAAIARDAQESMQCFFLLGTLGKRCPKGFLFCLLPLFKSLKAYICFSSIICWNKYSELLSLRIFINLLAVKAYVFLKGFLVSFGDRIKTPWQFYDFSKAIHYHQSFNFKHTIS